MSVKLNQDQIQFIEDYLIKNKVNYWDVRLELLDHIVSDLEVRMGNGQSFEVALEEVHVNFGNKPTLKKLSKDQKSWIFSDGIFADSSGYQKLIKEKGRQLNKAMRVELGKGLFRFLKNPLTLLGYIFFMFLFINSASWFNDEATVFKFVVAPLIVVSLAPLTWGLIKARKTFKSLQLASLVALPLLSMTIWNLMMHLPKIFIFGEDKGYPFWFLTLIVGILIPVTYVEVRLHLGKLRAYSKLQKKYLA